MRTFKEYALLTLKGMAMGAADVVPGVSGGTIAFITGIYEELISTISNISFKSISVLFKQGIKPFWKEVNGNFLVALLLGIFISILSLARLLTYLLENHSIPTWSFFFGLIVASIPLVGQRVKQWQGSRIFAFVAGAIIAWLITDLPPVEQTDASWYLFISGMIAICAMILPGISGSFILILLGSYLTLLAAVNDRDIVSILIFMAGAVVGILSFSRFLKFMFARFHDITIAVLSGFLLGSLNKIWPWKNVLEVFTKHEGELTQKEVPLITENVLPTEYTDLTGEPAHFILAVGMFMVGLLLIFGIQKIASKRA
ncbi:MAG TPA: DUF368 domain-containing protein [Cryomorphaceae bacterium]|nr:DUF368 domain-containing protein [Cryomorphaceae bacterium]